MSRIKPLVALIVSMGLSFVLLTTVNSLQAQPPATQPTGESGPRSKYPFSSNVKVSRTDQFILVDSDGIPTHKTGEFPNPSNPNRIQKQDYHFKLPIHPQAAQKPVRLPMGPIGVAINGIPFYNPYNREGNDAVEGPFAEAFDSCCGHPDQLGRYHYHKNPTCVKSPFHDTPGEHSALIGYAFDGYPIYGPQGEGGKPPTDLDECNGHTDEVRGYHYHVTSKFPYILGAYHGVPEDSNFDHRGRFSGGRRPEHPPGGGPGGRPDGPPPGP